MVELRPEPISREAFAPFGDLLETASSPGDTINSGTTERFSDLTRIQLSDAAAQACVHIYRAQGVPDAVTLRLMERHPLGSQLFMPLQGQPFVVVVAAGDAAPDARQLRAFLVDRGRGINFAPGTWHHPLLALTAGSEFLVVERTDPSGNLEEHALQTPARLIVREAG